MSNPIPKNVINELLDMHAMVSASSAAFSDAINDKAEEYEVSKGSLRKYIVARSSDKLDRVSREVEELATLLEVESSP